MSDQDILNKILATATPQEQAEIKILHNAQVATLKEYQTAQSAKTLKNWQTTKAAYQQEVESLAYRYGLLSGADQSTTIKTPESFAELKDVLGYLQQTGWQVSRSGIFKHQSDGKIKRDKQSSRFLLKTVEKYADNWLARAETGTNPKKDQSKMYDRKLTSEVRLKEAQAKKAELDLAVANGKYLLREDMERELVGRALILDSSFRHYLKNNAPEWIDLVGGDQKNLSILRDEMMATLDRVMNTFASTHDFVVELKQ